MDNRYEKLVASLKLLSLPINEQEKCFPDFANVPFEVVEIFNNSFLKVPQLMDEQKINNLYVPNIIRIHNLIFHISRDFDFSDIEDYERFSSSEGWNDIRRFAKEILQSMDVDQPLNEVELNYF